MIVILHYFYTQGITLSLIKAMQSYDPLKVTTHPKLDYIKQIMEGEALSKIMRRGIILII